jgi:hypothetical protein
MRQGAAILCGVLCFQPVESAFGSQTYPRIQIRAGVVPMLLLAALEGAARRLQDAECQRLFTDFHDASGTPLLDRLEATHKTAAEYLAFLWFVDGGDDELCKNSDILTAFTSSNSRVIHICGARFGDRSLTFEAREIVIIHEMLHSLGLGENPPNSAAITQQVRKRCGG